LALAELEKIFSREINPATFLPRLNKLTVSRSEIKICLLLTVSCTVVSQFSQL
jgi:hypothetical protein